jgi:UDP-N-acetylglucosamine--N-acetylmuramyl-(pentapeptide) pyrophosphoryl-undecaprenol N-acetylglucosamine transferase
MLNNKKIIISGGGTGGHIFPAIAIANALRRKAPEISILFVGAKGRMEMEKVPAAGYEIIGLNISGIQRRLTLKNLLVPFKIWNSIRKAKKIIKEFKPDVVVGVGGYASGPVLRAASNKKIPTVIQEQNSYPGITNKILAKKVNKICVAYDNMDRFFPKEKIYLTGNPVRSDIQEQSGKKATAFSFFDLSPDKKVLLVIGGSLGSRTINESIHSCLENLSNKNIQLIWQTGKAYFETAKDAIRKYETANFKVFDFINRMDLAYAACDVVVSRAGAIAVSEICVVNKPAILIPSPNVAEDHQTKNALALFNHKAVLLVKDVEARQQLCQEITELFENEEMQNKLKSNLAGLGIKNADDNIAAVIFSLIKD